MTWYRNPKVLSALTFLILIGLIWFVGPFIGLPSREARFLWIFLLMLLWVVILMTGKIIRDRSANLLEKVLRRNADDAVVSATPEQRAEVSLLRQRLLAAIETLKTSSLGKSRGKAALYDLPWYMLVGHPSAGKSCAILHSGLKFPITGKGAVAVQGIGGTRNCDWFFSTEGVLLDTAGRYSTQSEDRAEWIEFLQLLKPSHGDASYAAQKNRCGLWGAGLVENPAVLRFVVDMPRPCPASKRKHAVGENLDRTLSFLELHA